MATQQVQGRAWPGARSLAPLAENEAQGPVAQDQSDLDADQDLEVVPQRCFGLGGGNPKVMYLNYQLALATEAAMGSMGKVAVQALRTHHVQLYDSSPALRERWATIYKASKRKQHKKPDSSPARAPASSELWPGHMQQSTEETWPISQAALSKVCESHFPNEAALLAEATKDPTPFQIVEAVSVRGDQDQHAFGCQAKRHNVCRAMVAGRHLLGHMDRLQLAWNNWIRSFSKEVAASGDLVFVLQAPGEAEVAVWVLLADITFSPMVQTYVICCPRDKRLEQGGLYRGPIPHPEYVLEMAHAPSRLCHHGQGHFQGLWHITSDELLLLLVSESPEPWAVSRVDYDLSTEGPSLKLMRVTGHAGTQALEHQ